MKRGSALLIVLGMMAFMVISAVAFSAYMRYSRLPSSYLRRSSSSRLLVKAALAEAIDEIDAAIGNNPHPGVGTHAYTYDADTNSRRNGTSANRNSWFHRVYMGFQNKNNEQDIENSLVPADDTVATLTLEGLAYVPEPLVNEARYYSRRSSAAQWKNLDFESGRYAFCALDVSDYLDVNSVSANVGRGATPATRFSLAYLFEEPSQHRTYQNDPGSWDDFIRKFWKKTAAEASVDSGTGVGPKGGNSGGGAANAGRASSTLVPLVSVADLNLALNFYSPGGLRSSFCDYVEQARSSFYGGIGDTGAAAEKIRNMTFVTDGLYPPDPDIAAGKVLDLADGANQPFTDADLQKNAPQLSTLMDKGSTGAKWLQKYISGLGLAMLYDYLDEDNVPVSLALPSVERVPMVAGIQHDFSSAKLTVEEQKNGINQYIVETGSGSYPPTPTDGMKVHVQKEQIFKLKGADLSTPGTVKVLLAYPFRRGRDLVDPDSFKVDGCIEYYFTSGNMTFRTDNSADCLHVKSDSAGSPLKPVNACDGVLSGRLSEKPFSPGNVNPQNEEDALYEVTLDSQQAAGDIANALNNRNFITIVHQWTETYTSVNGVGSWNPNGDDTIVPAKGDGSATTSCGIPALKADGSVDPDFGTPATFAGWIANGTRDLKLRMNLWIRVRNGDNKTVDLVPACFGDDYTVCGQNENNGRGSGPAGAFMSIDGGKFPVMRFDDVNVLQVSQAGVTGGGNLDLTPKAVMCPDPRWNYAPEHWFTPGTAISKSDFLSKCGRDTGVKDCDIFMATSDAGYLQSVYELAFLPRIMDEFSGNKDYGLVSNPAKGVANWNASLADCSNNGLFWRTYSPYPHGGEKRDPFEDIGLVNEGGGMKVNPYADGTNTVLAALANTPSDWWATAAEADSSAGVPDSDRKSAKDFNKKYAFNAISGGNDKPKFAWEDLKAIASRIIGRMRANRQNSNIDFYKAWEDAWDDLGWDDESFDFCGINFTGDTDDLFDVDRKFLYGYWRECFAPKQQLFLVFVRAEPTMTGGSGIRQMPPQLGARAVALVWRDPTPSNDDYSPHQTRVLFYRQLD